jgi:hypothetical protein
MKRIGRRKLFRNLKRELFWLAAFSCMGFSGCNSEVDVELPVAPAKLVVVSFISPEAQEVQVSVTWSRPLNATSSFGKAEPVTGATVWISDGMDSVKLPIDFNNYYSTRSYPIRPGKTYSLRVTEPGGLSTFANCTVPVKICRSLTTRIDSSTFGTPSEEGNYVAEAQWQDLPGESDYYRTNMMIIRSDPATPRIEMLEPVYLADEPVTRDYQADGRSWKKQSISISNYRNWQRDRTLKYLHTFLYTCDRNYYEYHRSLFRSASNPGDAFSDPVKIYTNIVGGLGIFCAYRAYDVNIPLR